MASFPLANRVPCRLLLNPPWNILQQLCIEESLLRDSDQSWIVISRPQLLTRPTVVMGANGKVGDVLNAGVVERDGVAVIKRFTGGGTVALGKDAVLTSIVSSLTHLPDAGKWPSEILEWAGALAQHSLDPIALGRFQLTEFDYCVDDCKIGGNAQSLTKGRWVHHTSWLWDFDSSDMECLSIPSKIPDYRRGRNHDEFLTRGKLAFGGPDTPPDLTAEWFQCRLLNMFLAAFEPVTGHGLPLLPPSLDTNEQASALLDAAAGKDGPLFLQLQAAWHDAAWVHRNGTQRRSTKLLTVEDLTVDARTSQRR